MSKTLEDPEVRQLLEASLRWMQGGLNALDMIVELSEADAPVALLRGARCIHRAAERMAQAANLLAPGVVEP